MSHHNSPDNRFACYHAESFLVIPDKWFAPNASSESAGSTKQEKKTNLTMPLSSVTASSTGRGGKNEEKWKRFMFYDTLNLQPSEKKASPEISEKLHLVRLTGEREEIEVQRGS